MMRVWRLSVAYIGPKSRTDWLRNTKIGTEVGHVTCDSDTTFRDKKSKVNLQGGGSILWRPPAQLVSKFERHISWKKQQIGRWRTEWLLCAVSQSASQPASQSVNQSYLFKAHTHIVLTAISPDKPGLAANPLDCPFPLLNMLCILSKLAKTFPIIQSKAFEGCLSERHVSPMHIHYKLCGRPPQYSPAPASWPLTFIPIESVS